VQRHHYQKSYYLVRVVFPDPGHPVRARRTRSYLLLGLVLKTPVLFPFSRCDCHLLICASILPKPISTSNLIVGPSVHAVSVLMRSIPAFTPVSAFSHAVDGGLRKCLQEWQSCSEIGSCIKPGSKPKQGQARGGLEHVKDIHRDWRYWSVLSPTLSDTTFSLSHPDTKQIRFPHRTCFRLQTFHSTANPTI
jgi:hypothetical protein